MDDLAKEKKWPREFFDLIEALETEHVVFDNSDYQASSAGGDDPSCLAHGPRVAPARAGRVTTGNTRAAGRGLAAQKTRVPGAPSGRGLG